VGNLGLAWDILFGHGPTQDKDIAANDHNGILQFAQTRCDDHAASALTAEQAWAGAGASSAAGSASSAAQTVDASTTTTTTTVHLWRARDLHFTEQVSILFFITVILVLLHNGFIVDFFGGKPCSALSNLTMVSAQHACSSMSSFTLFSSTSLQNNVTLDAFLMGNHFAASLLTQVHFRTQFPLLLHHAGSHLFNGNFLTEFMPSCIKPFVVMEVCS